LIRARPRLDKQKEPALLQAADIFCQNKIDKAAFQRAGNASGLRL